MASSGEPIGATTVGPVVSNSENVRRAWRGKGYDRVRPSQGANLLAHDVRVGARWDIDSHNRRRACIQGGNGCGIQPAHRRTKTGSEDGIDQDVCVKDRTPRGQPSTLRAMTLWPAPWAAW